VKFRVPFESLLIFATNLEPEDLVDEAFLRRIQYKLYLPGPDRPAYTEIFRRVCEQRARCRSTMAAVDFVYDEYYEGAGITPRGCHPRDIVEHVLDVARYEDTVPPCCRAITCAALARRTSSSWPARPCACATIGPVATTRETRHEHDGRSGADGAGDHARRRAGHR
jgi:hypothetical protein